MSDWNHSSLDAGIDLEPKRVEELGDDAWLRDHGDQLEPAAAGAVEDVHGEDAAAQSLALAEGAYEAQHRAREDPAYRTT